jgi:Domain of unknown function (DUF1844)
MDEEQEERSFTVSDRRFSARRESEERPSERPPPADFSAQRPSQAPPQAGEPRATEADEINFASFLISLGTQAFMHLGDIPNPVTQQREKDLPAAKQMIDLLGILEAKTKGNLTPDEERLLRQLLTDLRLRYVRETSR